MDFIVLHASVAFAHGVTQVDLRMNGQVNCPRGRVVGGRVLAKAVHSVASTAQVVAVEQTSNGPLSAVDSLQDKLAARVSIASRRSDQVTAQLTVLVR